MRKYAFLFYLKNVSNCLLRQQGGQLRHQTFGFGLQSKFKRCGDCIGQGMRRMGLGRHFTIVSEIFAGIGNGKAQARNITGQQEGLDAFKGDAPASALGEHIDKDFRRHAAAR